MSQIGTPAIRAKDGTMHAVSWEAHGALQEGGMLEVVHDTTRMLTADEAELLVRCIHIAEDEGQVEEGEMASALSAVKRVTAP